MFVLFWFDLILKYIDWYVFKLAYINTIYQRVRHGGKIGGGAKEVGLSVRLECYKGIFKI